jgi:hypothetical protein
MIKLWAGLIRETLATDQHNLLSYHPNSIPKEVKIKLHLLLYLNVILDICGRQETAEDEEPRRMFQQKRLK